MTYNAKAQKKYRNNGKSLQFSVNYRPTDYIEGERLKVYLSQTGQSANSYIKGLIKADLDYKQFMIRNNE